MNTNFRKKRKEKKERSGSICILISIVYTPGQGLWKCQFLGDFLYWECLISLLGEARSFSSIKTSVTNYANYYVNSRIVDGKLVCFLSVCWFFSLLLWNFLFENSVCLTIHWNFQKGFHCCLLIALWKCEYCLIWALNKSIVWYDHEKSVYYSLIWKELSKNGNIAWYKLWKSM